MNEYSTFISGLLIAKDKKNVYKEFLYHEKFMNYIHDAAFICLFTSKLKEYAIENRLHKQISYIDYSTSSYSIDNKLFRAFQQYSFNGTQIIQVLDKIFGIEKKHTDFDSYKMFIDTTAATEFLHDHFDSYKMFIDTTIELCVLNDNVNKEVVEISYISAVYVLTRYFTDKAYRILIEELISGGPFYIRDEFGTVRCYNCLLNNVYSKLLNKFNIKKEELIIFDENIKRIIIRDNDIYDNKSSLYIKYLNNSNKKKCEIDSEYIIIHWDRIDLSKDQFINAIKNEYKFKSYKKAFKFIFSDIEDEKSFYSERKPIIKNIKFSSHNMVSFDIIFNSIKEKENG